ncbi:MAG TPA: chorismate synthase [Candidatus Eisenbergiella merdigallinarum]|uniref:Chorismate synthase n=1 Tax=Candidatus Eisenbergiella merdigallinarum TaxID=2838552 RepID=A0A9D2SBP9_9FIRM|nr:chorismate synthase [Candidatus Eisenbergiella merdigallinarum]
MAGSTFGTHFTITTWGESHGKALGAVVDGCPAGLSLQESDIQAYLDRRKPGSSPFSTPRKEADQVQILSGVFEGKTTGTPISLLIPNTSQRSSDYSEIASYYRPGHADYTFDAKYGFRDYRGGGRSSGRETAARVAGGAIAAKILKELGIGVRAYTKSIGPVSIDPARFDPDAILQTATAMPDREADERAREWLSSCIEEKDSSGGVVECVISGMPAGVGEPVFEKLDARLGSALFSIGAVKAVEIGDGTAVSSARGSENNDPFRMRDGRVVKSANHAGGVLGGISDGSDVVMRVHIKPTPSIFRPQDTVGADGQERTVCIRGRHDPVIVPRAVVVVECMAALTAADLLFSNMSARMDKILSFYGK